MITLYGIKNCDTVKKARTWLDKQGVNYTFHDFRQEGLSEAQVTQWLEHLPLDKLVNKRSTTWKNLQQQAKDNLSEKTAPALCASNETLVKRPVLDTGKGFYLGFNDKQYQDIFNRTLLNPIKDHP